MPDITMPQLGETVTEGTITKWFKRVGDEVSEDEPLFEVSTDKVDSEFPSPAGGYLAEILVQEGETVDVGAKLAVISDSAPSGNGDGKAEVKDEAKDAPEAPKEEMPAPPAEERGPSEEAASPEPQEDAVEEERRAAEAPEAKQEKPEAEDEPEAEEKPAPSGDGGGGGGQVLSPVVRRLISENDLDASTIKGTGAGGRITRSDVRAVIEGKGAAQPKKEASKEAKEKAEPAPAPAPAAATAPAAPSSERDEVVPFTNIRRRTAEHMVRSKATSAHTLTAIEVDYEKVDRVRRAHKDAFKDQHGASLTYLPFIARAVIDAIRDYPNINSSVGDDALVVHRDIHLGIAVDLDLQGLLVPVIKAAADKRLPAIAREITELANKARSKKLSADEIQGGTFTITNPGPFGTFLTAPIINQPQVAILSTDGIKKRPVVVELPDGSDGIAVHPTGNLALSFDHRVIDGAYASAFLARIKEYLETRDWEQEL